MTKKAKTKKYMNLTEGTTGFVESVLFGLHNKNKKSEKEPSVPIQERNMV